MAKKNRHSKDKYSGTVKDREGVTQKSGIKRFFLTAAAIIFGVPLCVTLVFAAIILYLTATEYKPEETQLLVCESISEKATGEKKEDTGESEAGKAAEDSSDNTLDNYLGKSPAIGESIRIQTWNIGYGGLGEAADFFMDGGSSVRATDKNGVNANLEAMANQLKSEGSDIILLQEVDVSSKRSYYINEYKYFLKELSENEAGNSGVIGTFATNFKTAYVPYPLPTIGKVESGLETFSFYEIEEAIRYQLPVSFGWPVRVANLKRCVSLHRIKIENSDKYLTIINVHLEAYDDGEGKEAQMIQLAELMQAEYDAGNYVIAGGDFNQTFPNVDYSVYPNLENTWTPGVLYAGAFHEEWRFLTDSSTPTCRSLDRALTDAENREPDAFQYYVIDGFLVSDNITVNSVDTINLEFKNSDHNTVIMDFTLNR